MANAVLQMLMVSGAGGAPVPWPGSPVVLHDVRYAPSVLNASNVPASFYDRVATVRDLSGNNNHATQATDSKRCRYLRHEGDNYVFFRSANVPSMAYNAAMNLGDEFTIEAKLGPISWATGALQLIAVKGGQYFFAITETGGLRVSIEGGGITALSTSAMPFVALQPGYVRVHYTRNTGSGQYAVLFYTSLDGNSWTQLGSTVTGASGIATPTSTSVLNIARWSGGAPFTGRFYWIILRNGNPASPPVINWNANNAAGLDLASSTETITGAVFTFALENYFIAAGALLLIASEQNAYTLATNFPIPAADFTVGMSGQRTGTWLASYGPTSGGGTMYGVHLEANGVFACNAAGYFGTSAGHGIVSGPINAVCRRTGSTNVIIANGSSKALFAFVPAAGNNIATFAVRDTLWGEGIIHCGAIWLSSEDTTAVETWQTAVP